MVYARLPALARDSCRSAGALDWPNPTGMRFLNGMRIDLGKRAYISVESNMPGLTS
jgi:hypothetical protein